MSALSPEVVEELRRQIEDPLLRFRGVEGCYLLHFDPPHYHAEHYLGFATDISRRVTEHYKGLASSPKLIRVVLAAGCKIKLVRVWSGADRNFERRLKNQGGLSRQCPVCRRRGTYHR